MTKEKLIKFLKSSVHIQDPEIDNDSGYLAMSDEDLELYLTVALSRDFSKVRSLDEVPEATVYPLMLLAKKELYYALAVIEAPLYDMGADNNNYLKREQRFQHYMKLIGQIDTEYERYLDDNATGTDNTLTTYDVLLSNRYYTRNYRSKGVAPVVSLYADNVGTDSVELSWDSVVINFSEFRIYISEQPIYDPYNLEKPISDTAKLLFRVREDTSHKCRINDLKQNKVYYILIEYIDKCGLKGFSQIVIDTTPPIEEDSGGVNTDGT